MHGRRSCAHGYVYGRYLRVRYLVGLRGARALACVLALLTLGAWGVHESRRLPSTGGGPRMSEDAQQLVPPVANHSEPRVPSSVRAPQPLQRLARTGTPAVEPARGAPDVAILMLACNRLEETTFALSAWSQVRGIAHLPFYVSMDCSPGIALDEDAWRAQGLSLHVVSSHQRFAAEVGAQAARRDERVTRHWLSAVTRVLSLHDFVLYAEDDHVVLPEIVLDMFALLALGQQTCADCFAVQLGCHGDCWGAATSDASRVGLMEPGNMGVVYSRDKWRWFSAHIAEFCRPYGGWDVNLHLFLEAQPTFKYALTLLKTRISEMPSCRSSRTRMRADCDWAPVRAGIQAFLRTAQAFPNTTTPPLAATALRVFPHSAPAPRADAETFRRCVASVAPPRASEGSLSIYIPVARMRMELLCALLEDIASLTAREMPGYSVRVHLVRAGTRADPARGEGLWDLAPGLPHAVCGARTGASEVHVVRDMPGYEPLPPALAAAVVHPLYHAALHRRQQTWDYVQMLTLAADTPSTLSLFLEDDVHICPDFFGILHRLLAAGQPFVFVGGFGASALGFPAAGLRRLAQFLRARVRDSNLDVLVSKGLMPGTSWYDTVGPAGPPLAAEDWFTNLTCAYKPAHYLVLHRGGSTSNFGSAHVENPLLHCGAPDVPRYFVAEFARGPDPALFSRCVV